MMNSKANFSDFLNVTKRECNRLVRQPVYIYTLIGAPLLVAIFFITLVHSGLPQNLPIGLIDMDNTPTTRSIARNLNAFEHSEIIANYPSILEAREAVQRGEIYGFFYIPTNFTKDVSAMRRPTLSYYTNDSYILAGSGIYVDMKTMATLASAKVVRSTLIARGLNDQQIAGLLQPISIDAHQINNPWASYAIYLCSDFVPGIFMLLFLLITVYTILNEVKMKTSREWVLLSKRSMIVALSGKLFPQFLIECLIVWGYDYTMYFILGFPCASGFGVMMFGGVLMVLASQGFAIFISGIMPSLRMGISTVSLWGIISLSIGGISFPLPAMDPPLQYLAQLFPLRHYIVFSNDQALNGYDLKYSIWSIVGLCVFALLPLLVLRILYKRLVKAKYIP